MNMQEYQKIWRMNNKNHIVNYRKENNIWIIERLSP